jgi:hypothetical protein
MQKGLLWFGGSVVFGCSVLAHLPAPLVVPAQVGKLQLHGISGTVWRGQIGQLAFAGKALPVRGLDWAVRPAALLSGKLEAGFSEQGTPTNRGTASVGLLSRQVQLQTLHWQLPPGSIDAWFRAGVSLQGDFVLDVQALRLPAGKLFPSQLDAQLRWNHAALQFDSEFWQLGAPLVQLSVAGDAIEGALTNAQAMLPGSGSFRCTSTACQVEFKLTPTPDAPQSLLNALLLVGLQPSGDSYSGQISLSMR